MAAKRRKRTSRRPVTRASGRVYEEDVRLTAHERSNAVREAVASATNAYLEQVSLIGDLHGQVPAGQWRKLQKAHRYSLLAMESFKEAMPRKRTSRSAASSGVRRKRTSKRASRRPKKRTSRR